MVKSIHLIRKKPLIKNIFIILFTFFFIAFFSESYALPFNIVPNGVLPTTVPIGGSVNASYLVTNNTSSTRINNFVKSLPPNVSLAAGGCSTNFNLMPKGQPADTCTLNLTITGPVNANDPNPGNHLFVCFPGGKTCAGTLFALNVIAVSPVPTPVPTPTPQAVLTSISITPTNAAINIGQTLQYTATGTYSDGTTKDITSTVTWNSSNPLVATISTSGLATGISTGTTIITAVSGSITSNSANLTVASFAYITDFNNGNISFCPINANGSFGTCNVTGNVPVAAGIFINSAGTTAYVASSTFFVNGNVFTCPINQTDRSLGTCVSAGSIGLSGQIRDVILNSAENVAYVVQRSPAPGGVFFCPVTNGILGFCTPTGNGFTLPDTIVLNPQGTKAYVTESGVNIVSICTIDQTDGSFVPGSCVSAGATGITNPFGMALNNTGTRAYITDHLVSLNASAITQCSIDQTTGSFLNCSTALTNIDRPFGFTLDASNTFAYIATDNVITFCQVAGAVLVNCGTTGNGLSGPYGIAIR